MNAELHTIVTAGHVDHGKTALVRLLTGFDTDRLPEEKQRGLTITLGYAPLELKSGREASIIDAPGHHKFVRTMVSGATGVSGFLMTIAADDGVMPQTIEHAAVLSALGIERGVVAITKSDLANPEPAIEAAGEILPGLPRIACSATTGEGMEDLRMELERLLSGDSPIEQVDQPAVLHADRVFVIKGSGVVVTGTLRSGIVRVGDSLEHVPGEQLVRIRQLHVNNRAQEHAVAGQRVALNLSGTRRRELNVGDVLGTPGYVRESRFLDCALGVKGLENRAQVHVHHGTRHSPARAFALGNDLWQLRLENPLIAADGDRVLLRSTNPAGVLGGGLVLDCRARRHGPGSAAIRRLRRRQRGDFQERTETAAASVATPDSGSIPSMPDNAEQFSQLALEAGIGLLNIADIDCDASAVAALAQHGFLIRVSRDAVSHEAVREEVLDQLVELIGRDGEATLGSLKNHLGVSRRVALAWLSHFDSTQVTLKMQDERRILKRKVRS